MSINPKTGQDWYAGSWEAIKNVCKALDIGEGRMASVDEAKVEFYMSMVEEQIDAQLEPYYYVPLRPFNQKQPSGLTKSVFPGNIRQLAVYWTAGLLLKSEFQQNEPNVQEIAQNYIDDSMKALYAIIRYNQRLQGQRQKHRSHTMPPTMAPANIPELNV